MGAGILVSLDEYLETAYSPDREYVDGAIVERNVGERPHSIVQRNLTVVIDTRYPNFWVLPGCRVRTLEGRCRVPDVCVLLEDPGTDVIEIPPFLVIEILSRHDAMADVLEKLDEYHAAGVRNIWLIDPRKKKAFTIVDGRFNEVAAEELVTESPEIRLTFAEIFRGL